MHPDKFNLALSELIQSSSETMDINEIVGHILVRAAMLSSIASETDSQALAEFQDSASQAMEMVLLSEDFHQILENARAERNTQQAGKTENN